MRRRIKLFFTAIAMMNLVFLPGHASAQVSGWDAAWGAYMAIGAANGALSLYDRLSPKAQQQPAQQPQPAPQPQSGTAKQNASAGKNSTCVTHQPDYDDNGIFWGYKTVRVAC